MCFFEGVVDITTLTYHMLWSRLIFYGGSIEINSSLIVSHKGLMF